MPLLLDTSVVIDALRGRFAGARIRALVESGEVPYICAVVSDEVQRGVRPEDQGRAALMFASLRAVPLGVLEGALAGTWRRDFAARGITLHQADCLIAAAAVAANATIATGNPKDFPMEGVAVAHWPVGE